jgi:hypothetical protein
MIPGMGKLTLSLVSVLAALALATAGGAAQILRGPNLPPGWSHAEINVVVRHQPHTLTYDRGRVQIVTASSLTLKERDGTVWTINVAPTATITIGGSPAQLSQVRPREIATTIAVDGGPAVSVTVQIPPQLARQQTTLRAARR